MIDRFDLYELSGVVPPGSVLLFGGIGALWSILVVHTPKGCHTVLASEAFA